MKRLVTIGLLFALAIYAFRQYRDHSAPSEPVGAAEVDPLEARSTGDSPVENPGGWRCDGRTHCSQMTSCKEAKYFLKNCPGTQMDGDRDGVPCEQQWCTGILD